MVPIPKPESTTVLVVGAGPAGLATAVSLVEHGCKDVVVVDPIIQRDRSSRALAVHAGTLEALDKIGCGKELASRGVHSVWMEMTSRLTGKLLSVSFAYLARYTKYPFTCVVPQSETEDVLVERAKSLGIRVYRPCKVTGFKPQLNDDGTVTACLDGGETIRAKYIVGADGARSLVRQAAGVGFSDPDGVPRDAAGQMAVANVLFEETPGPEWRDRGNVFLSRGNTFVLVPIPHPHSQANAFRVAFWVPPSAGVPPQVAQPDFIQPYVDKCGPIWEGKPPRVAEIVWYSRYRTHSAIAERVFFRFDGKTAVDGQTSTGDGGSAGIVTVLVGDAAHIHSPLGGQGMNLGLRDAVALGPVLVEHIRRCEGGATAADADTIVEQWASTRHARAMRVIRMTKRMGSIYGEPSTPGFEKYLRWFPIEPAVVRDWVLWLVGHFSFVTDRMAYQMSGLEDLDI